MTTKDWSHVSNSQSTISDFNTVCADSWTNNLCHVEIYIISIFLQVWATHLQLTWSNNWKKHKKTKFRKYSSLMQCSSFLVLACFRCFPAPAHLIGQMCRVFSLGKDRVWCCSYSHYKPIMTYFETVGLLCCSWVNSGIMGCSVTVGDHQDNLEIYLTHVWHCFYQKHS